MSGPQIELTAGGVAVVAALVVGGFLVWRASKVATSVGSAAVDAAKQVGTWLNPTSTENLAYQGVNAIGSAITGDRDFSLGGWVYDKTHDNTSTERTVPTENTLYDAMGNIIGTY